MHSRRKLGLNAQHWARKPQPLAVLFYLFAKEARSKQGECRVLAVKGYMSSPWHRLRQLPAAPLVVRRRYLIEMPRPMPAAPLVVRRRYLIVVLWQLHRCASRVLSRGAQADERGHAGT
jgi:hypothetical protein